MKLPEITSLKALLAKPFAKQVERKMKKWISKPMETQNKVFQDLISEGAGTLFGKDHDFVSINSYKDASKGYLKLW